MCGLGGVVLEISFIILCLAIAISIPCYGRRIRVLKEARIASKVHLVFAVMLFLLGIGLFAFTKQISCTVPTTCEICSGSGIRPNGKPCLLCSEKGEYLVSEVSYTIPLLYPACMIALSIYTILLNIPLLELIEHLDTAEDEFPDFSSSTRKRKPRKSTVRKIYCKLHRVELFSGTYCPYCMRVLSQNDIDLQ